MRFGGIGGGNGLPAQHVLAIRYGFQVRRVNARSVPAEMIKL
jgi:hypothetical protein